MKWIKASEREPNKDYSFGEDEFGQFPIRWEFEYRTVIGIGYYKDGVIHNGNSNKPMFGDYEWLDETPTEAKGKGYIREEMEQSHMAGQMSAGCKEPSYNEANAYLSSLPPVSIEQEKWVEIDFNKRLKARIKVTGNTVEVDDAIDGWGDNIDKERIVITNLSTPPIEQR